MNPILEIFDTFVDFIKCHSSTSLSDQDLSSHLETINPGVDLSDYSPEQMRNLAQEMAYYDFDDADISFEGNYDVECRDKAASHLIDDLERHRITVRSSDIYHEKDMGGLTKYTANVIKEAINNARLHGNIDNRTFENLMKQVKDACYCG